MEVSDQLRAPLALSPGKENPVPVGQEAGWVPQLVRKLWRKISCPCVEFVHHPVPRLVTITASALYRYFAEFLTLSISNFVVLSIL
jgi:hypothetical protein